MLEKNVFKGTTYNNYHLWYKIEFQHQLLAEVGRSEMPVVFLNRFIVTRSHFNFKQYLLGHGEDHLVVIAQKHQKECAVSMRRVVMF